MHFSFEPCSRLVSVLSWVSATEKETRFHFPSCMLTTHQHLSQMKYTQRLSFDVRRTQFLLKTKWQHSEKKFHAFLCGVTEKWQLRKPSACFSTAKSVSSVSTHSSDSQRRQQFGNTQVSPFPINLYTRHIEKKPVICYIK